MKKRSTKLLLFLMCFVFLSMFSFNVSAKSTICKEYKLYMEDGSFLGTVKKIGDDFYYEMNNKANKLQLFSIKDTSSNLEAKGTDGLYGYYFALDENECKGKLMIKKVKLPYSWDIEKSDSIYHRNKYVILVFSPESGISPGKFISGSIVNIIRMYTLSPVNKKIEDQMIPTALGINSMFSYFKIHYCTENEINQATINGEKEKLGEGVIAHYYKDNGNYFMSIKSDRKLPSSFEAILYENEHIDFFGLFNFNIKNQVYAKHFMLSSGTTCIKIWDTQNPNPNYSMEANLRI